MGVDRTGVNGKDVYICFCCGYPIIFRYWPPQVFHLGTGWPCWEMQQKGECDNVSYYIRIPSITPKKERDKLVGKAEKLYSGYVRNSDAKPVLGFIKKEFGADRFDVVRDFLSLMGKKRDRSRNELVSSIVTSKPWRDYVRRLKGRGEVLIKARRLCEEYKGTGDAGPVLEFVKGCCRSDKLDALCDLLAYLGGEENEHNKNLVNEIAESAPFQRLCRRINKREELSRAAEKPYDVYVRTGNAMPILRLIRRRLLAKEVEFAIGLLGYLGSTGDGDNKKLLNIIVASGAWQSSFNWLKEAKKAKDS